jgi:hypothetical protein
LFAERAHAGAGLSERLPAVAVGWHGFRQAHQVMPQLVEL